MALLPALFPPLPPTALERMNGEYRRWVSAADEALALRGEEERWLELGRVFHEARELTTAAIERLAEEEGLPEDERGLGTAVCADGSRLYLTNGLALYVVTAPLEGASYAHAAAGAARFRGCRDEQRVVELAWNSLLRAGQGNGTRLALPLLIVARYRGLHVAACPLALLGDVNNNNNSNSSSVATDAELRSAAAPLLDAPPVVRALTSQSTAFSAHGPRLFLTGLTRELLARDSLWPSLTPLPALLLPADTSEAVRVELIPRAGWAEALEALLGAQHEAWHLPGCSHSLFYQPPPAALNTRAAKLYLGGGVQGAPAELRGTVLFVARFRESVVLVRPETGLAAQSSSAADVTSQLEMRLTALVEKLHVEAPTWPWQLVEELHTAGLPARYLGLVRMRAKEPRLRRLLLVEGAVRALKARLAERQARRPIIEGNAVILQFFNAVLGDGAPSERLWRVHVPHLIAWKFPLLLTAKESSPGADLRPLLTHHRVALLRGLQRATGVRLMDVVESRLLEASSLRLPGTMLSLADIASVSPQVRTPALPHAALLARKLAEPSEQRPARHGTPVAERKVSTMDPRKLAERQEEEADGWVFVERNSAARRSQKTKPPAPPPQSKPPADDSNCIVQ